MEHSVGQVTHLWVITLLAGVLPKGVRKGDYLLECPHDSVVEGATAGAAPSQVRPSGEQFARAARWADKVAWLGGSSVRWNLRSSHLFIPFFGGGVRTLPRWARTRSLCIYCHYLDHIPNWRRRQIPLQKFSKKWRESLRL